MKFGATVAIAAGLSVVATAHAEAVSVTGERCSQTVRVAANNAPLSEVLHRLAIALDFDLAFEALEDPPVTTDASGSAVDLVMTLADRANISIAQQRDLGCTSGKRIVSVWILPRPRAADTTRGADSAAPLVSKAALANARTTTDGNYWLITSAPPTN